MEIYRFFHPHHNPRLITVPLRQQELSELEQAAAELRKALVRAQQRMEKKPVAPLMPQHFADIIKAMNFVERSLQTLCDAHPGETREQLMTLLAERDDNPGWEHWSELVKEQLSSDLAYISADELDRR